jgi:hypothetical protein
MQQQQMQALGECPVGQVFLRLTFVWGQVLTKLRPTPAAACRPRSCTVI